MSLDVLLVGAGQRGRYVYGAFAAGHPELIRVTAVVEPDARRREQLGDIHGIPPRRRFADHEAVDVAADAWIIASSDQHHLAPTLAAFASGAHVLVEKPMAASYADSLVMVAAAEQADRQLHVAHVLRYTPFFTTLHELIASGRLGDIVTVEHRENVVHWHMAHSFVRGNWASAAASTPMIVQKCCHDFDVLEWNAVAPVAQLHSFGSLFHFRPEHAPDGAPGRCTDGCSVAETCPFEATRLYMNPQWTGWPVHTITDDLSPAGRMAALRHGPYGRCVYTAGSDVVDNQVVTMQRTDGSTWVLVMHGHAAAESRTMRYDGTRATLRATFGPSPAIELHEHGRSRIESVRIREAAGGHGGGDTGLLHAFAAAIRDGGPVRTPGRDALESHLLAFAAEESRQTGRVIDITARRATGHGSEASSSR